MLQALWRSRQELVYVQRTKGYPGWCIFVSIPLSVESCQQQRDDDLRDKTDDPQDQRVAEILGQIGREQGDVVFQTHKVGSDDLQTAAVILKKAVIDGGCQRDQLEYREDDKERRNEDVAPFRVADRPFLFLFSHRIASCYL